MCFLLLSRSAPCARLWAHGIRLTGACALVPRHRRATCFIINAPKWATFGWSVVRPLINDRTRAKIIISNGVPDVLRQALGGEEALQRMLNSVPPTLPIPSHEVDAQVG